MGKTYYIAVNIAQWGPEGDSIILAVSNDRKEVETKVKAYMKKNHKGTIRYTYNEQDEMTDAWDDNNWADYLKISIESFELPCEE